MLVDASLSNGFWAEAVSTSVYIVNRLPCAINNNKTPYELWSNKKPNLTFMRIFGCTAMVHVPKEKRRKLDVKSIECIFVGYCNASKAYRLFEKATKKIHISRDVIFIEEKTNREVVLHESNQTNYVYLPAVIASVTDAIETTENESTTDAANENVDLNDLVAFGGTEVVADVHNAIVSNDMNVDAGASMENKIEFVPNEIDPNANDNEIESIGNIIGDTAAIDLNADEVGLASNHSFVDECELSASNMTVIELSSDSKHFRKRCDRRNNFGNFG